MENRIEGIKWANKLQEALGEGYEVRYDDGESCLTRVYYRGYFVKEVPNTEINGKISVPSFAVDYNTRCAIDYEYERR